MSWLSAREAESPHHSPPGLPGSSSVLRGLRPPRRPPQAGPDGPAPRRPERVPLLGRACRSPVPGRPRTHVGPARLHLLPPPETGARDRRDPERHSSVAPPPAGRRQPTSPRLRPDNPGGTRCSSSSHPPSSSAWPRPH
ncbi:hypothetical protein NDU88_006093 [Pleurodeles waltl]|uniref:Uncharacterized protein n=1 Tax=Pleurodeles waltl TaxID=8319 RepID=A0AAV7PQF6_PLEWA|nr:hypothetical protein NDU88_006093 [Pleurodeles waltl]